MRKYILSTLCIIGFAASANAKDIPKTAPKAEQNAFTRAIKEPLSDIVIPVENPKKVPCNSPVDCRKKGADLSTVWQMKNSTDYSPKNYPAHCYIPSDDGKYIYSAAAC